MGKLSDIAYDVRNGYQEGDGWKLDIARDVDDLKVSEVEDLSAQIESGYRGGDKPCKWELDIE